VGRELRGRCGLIEWFLSQRAFRVSGFARALYNGLTTDVMADLVATLLIDQPDLDGIWHIASESISKYELLRLVNCHYGLGVDVARDDNVVMDRRLDGSRFQARTGYTTPTWDNMIAQMRADPTPYGI
jgi:dTDP-4-dehydrorhamnose reductase